MRINPITGNAAEHAGGVIKNAAGGESSFAEQLKSKIGEVDDLQRKAEDAMKQGAVNGATNVHETMIRLEEADIGLRLLTRVRNKAMDAYHEMMRMQF